VSEKIPDDLQYTKSHEWVRLLPGGEVEVGITDHAQEALGDLVFVELPQVGAQVTAGAACAVVESVKAASDVYCAVTGRITGRNEELVQKPELLNSDPYGAGWMMRVHVDASATAGKLLSAREYAESLKEAQ
jgi:glycine cleavage system H protein